MRELVIPVQRLLSPGLEPFGNVEIVAFGVQSELKIGGFGTEKYKRRPTSSKEG